MNRRLPIVALAVLLAGGVAWWAGVPERLGWGGGRVGDTLYGNVDIRQVQLGFRVGGRIAASRVDEGDAVAAGQELARLDPVPLQESLSAAAAAVAGRTADRDRLVAGPRPEEIIAARAGLAARQAALVGAEKEFVRARTLRPGGAIAQSVLDQALATRDTASGQVAEAAAQLRLLEEGYRAEDVAAARAALAAAEASRASAATALDDAVLRAPADGVVISRVREPGAIVGAGDIVFVLSLERPVWVRAYVPESELGRLHPGLKVTLNNDTAPRHRYHATVGFISPVAEFTPKSVETPELRTDLVYRLRLVVDDPDPALRQGMPVTVHLPPVMAGGRDER